MLYKQNEIDDIIQAKFESRELKRAISCLSDVQKRRIKLYYFEDKTIEEIAKLERTSHQAVSENNKSWNKKYKENAKKIKKFLK